MKKITLKKQTDKFSVFQFFMLTVAGIINSIGVVMFLSPMKLYDSGFSGTSMLLSQITPEMFSLSFFLLVLNIPFFLYGFKLFQVSEAVLPFGSAARSTAWKLWQLFLQSKSV